MTVKKNPAIILCRICSMFLIVLCHIISRYTFVPGHQFWGQIFNCAVFTFLAISGYLYGTKTIGDFRMWLEKRIKSVFLPSLIVIAFVFFCTAVSGEQIHLFSMVMYFLNLQGLGFIFSDFYSVFRDAPGLGPLWFMTIIMICYLTIPVLQKLRALCGKRITGIKVVFWSIVSCILSYAISVTAGISLIYFVSFAVGYFAGAGHLEKKMDRFQFFLLTLLMLLSQVCRLLFRAAIDGTMAYQTFVSISQLVLGIWIMMFFFRLEKVCPKFCDRMAGCKIAAVLSDSALYIYMVHYLFCSGFVDVYAISANILTATFWFVLATAAGTYLLKRLTEFLSLRL